MNKEVRNSLIKEWLLNKELSLIEEFHQHLIKFELDSLYMSQTSQYTGWIYRDFRIYGVSDGKIYAMRIQYNIMNRHGVFLTPYDVEIKDYSKKLKEFIQYKRDKILGELL